MKKILAIFICSFVFTSAFAQSTNNNLEDLTISAELGDAQAQSSLGAMYYFGLGVPHDFGLAKVWIEKAAHQGHSGAQFLLGEMYSQGKGVRRDYALAKIWLEKSARQENAMGQFGLGIMYSQGQGVRQNHVSAKEWYGRACDNGFQLGCDEFKKLNEAGW